ncbi:VCBS repeat-containing protein [Streptomyces globisporus]|uniref:FG-GAP repeat domain-containing protein n=1 Tax=Streptomyces globisporus TaxID=1908 RepID=UPI00068F6509|nr:VCBS repeat-containing protein [Streptomyces globisporus]
MQHTRTPVPRRPRRLGVAALAALAVTAGVMGGPAAFPAAAVPAAPAASAAAAVGFPPGGELWSLGRTGFLDRNGSYQARWTRFSDGAVIPFPSAHTVLGSRDSDVVIDTWDRFAALKDMATGPAGTELYRIDLDTLGTGAQVTGAVDRHLFVSDSGGSLLVYSPSTGSLPTKRAVSGLPADASRPWAVGAAGNTALVTYQTGTGRHWALVDLTTGAVTAQRQVPNLQEATVSATHVAWTEQGADGNTTVVVLNRATGAVQRVPPATQGKVVVGLVGNWVTYGQADGLREYGPSPYLALTARELTTGTTRKLLDHVDSAIDAPGDAIGVLGGTVAQGRGLYRITPGTGGVPVATLVAPSGEPTKVTLLGSSIPSTIDLSRTKNVDLKWRLSRINVSATLTLRNTRTGDTLVDDFHPLSEQATDFTYAHYVWQGDTDWPGEPDRSTGAKTGTYTWRIDAEPLNGIGPALVASGSFTVVRSRPQPHDFDSDGSPDLLTRDSAGRLVLADTFHKDYGSGFAQLQEQHSKLVGQGFGIYDRLEATGDLGGSAVGDFVARDKAGVLWLFKGRGDTTFAGRIRVGGGWQAYHRLTGGSDLTGDGRADLLATDKAGVLWLYPGTGRDTAPFAPRRRIGGGWGGYDQLTAVGDLAGGPAGDLVARDTAGVLWLYLGKGDGTFAPRTRIGGGWGGYSRLVGIGDADRDGRADLYAPGLLYRGTGVWNAPLRPREETSPYYFHDWQFTSSYRHFF